ncbi:MAG: hypothetical protein M0Z53_01385 [Thermaerobacter sp.]|nr:hypothetical protein [Thermaerobacter sp.]
MKSNSIVQRAHGGDVFGAELIGRDMGEKAVIPARFGIPYPHPPKDLGGGRLLPAIRLTPEGDRDLHVQHLTLEVRQHRLETPADPIACPPPADPKDPDNPRIGRGLDAAHARPPMAADPAKELTREVAEVKQEEMVPDPRPDPQEFHVRSRPRSHHHALGIRGDPRYHLDLEFRRLLPAREAGGGQRGREPDDGPLRHHPIPEGMEAVGDRHPGVTDQLIQPAGETGP